MRSSSRKSSYGAVGTVGTVGTVGRQAGASLIWTQVLVEGRWLQLTDALELEVLERCSGSSSVAEIAREIAEEAAEDGEAMLEAVEARMRHLFELRLISMGMG